MERSLSDTLPQPQTHYIKHMRLIFALLLLLPAPALAGDPLLNVSYDGLRSFPTGEELPLRTRFFGTEDGLAGSYHFVGDGKLKGEPVSRFGTPVQERDIALSLLGQISVNNGLELADDGRSFQGRWVGPRGTQGTWTGEIRKP